MYARILRSSIARRIMYVTLEICTMRKYNGRWGSFQRPHRIQFRNTDQEKNIANVKKSRSVYSIKEHTSFFDDTISHPLSIRRLATASNQTKFLTCYIRCFLGKGLEIMVAYGARRSGSYTDSNSTIDMYQVSLLFPILQFFCDGKFSRLHRSFRSERWLLGSLLLFITYTECASLAS